MTTRKLITLLACGFAGLFVYFAWQPEALAVPSFARKYQTSCLTCHTVFPMLNSFGEAFRRNGYRMPSTNNSVDSDSVKDAMIPMGQEEYRDLFPSAVIPDKIMDGVPLSIMLNGSVTMNFPDSDAKAAAGNVFTWSGVEGEAHIFAAGAFNDNLTYFGQLTIDAPSGLVDVETGYLLWNDIVGPRHMFNLWIGRLFSPQLTSFGLHSSYLADTMRPSISIAGLYNQTGSWSVGQSHNDGIELNGIIAHRFAYALGWLASSSAAGLSTFNAQDVYAHIGIKSGGIALDGEGKYGPTPHDPMKPWAETSITLDLFAYHGLNVLDNGTGVPANTVEDGQVLTPVAMPQQDSVGVLGGAVRGQLGSLIATAGLRFEHHDAPYQGTPWANNLDGTPLLTHGDAWVQYNEIDYVVFPWLVPGVRTELTTMSLDPSTSSAGSQHATLLRIIPGIATLLRQNIRAILTGDLEYAYGMPVGGPQYAGTWAPAGGSIVAPGPGMGSKIEAETITATVSVAF